jgi:hypothetical protein
MSQLADRIIGLYERHARHWDAARRRADRKASDRARIQRHGRRFIRDDDIALPGSVSNELPALHQRRYMQHEK